MSHLDEPIEKCSAGVKINKTARSRAKRGPPPPVSSTRSDRITGSAASDSSSERGVGTDIKRSSTFTHEPESLETNATKVEKSAELQRARETMESGMRQQEAASV